MEAIVHPRTRERVASVAQEYQRFWRRSLKARSGCQVSRRRFKTISSKILTLPGSRIQQVALRAIADGTHQPPIWAQPSVLRSSTAEAATERASGQASATPGQACATDGSRRDAQTYVDRPWQRKRCDRLEVVDVQNACHRIVVGSHQDRRCGANENKSALCRTRSGLRSCRRQMGPKPTNAHEVDQTCRFALFVEPSPPTCPFSRPFSRPLSQPSPLAPPSPPRTSASGLGKLEAVGDGAVIRCEPARVYDRVVARLAHVHADELPVEPCQPGCDAPGMCEARTSARMCATAEGGSTQCFRAPPPTATKLLWPAATVVIIISVRLSLRPCKSSATCLQ